MTRAGSARKPGPVQGLNRKLLDELGLDQEARDRCRELCENETFICSLDGQGLLHLSRLALAHGLLDHGLSLLQRLNERFPENEAGWQEHCEALVTLGRGQDALKVQARARMHGVSLGSEPLKGVLAQGPDYLSPKELDLDPRPFNELKGYWEGIKAYMGLFRGRDDCFARQWSERQEDGTIKTGYYPVKRGLTDTDIEEHLKGRKTYGIYLLNRDGMVWVGVIDCDLAKEWRQGREAKKNASHIKAEARFILKRLNELSRQWGLRCLVEFSGGKGYHLWYPCRQPVEAGAMKRALTFIAKDAAKGLEFFNLEVFPKQERLSGKGYGNLVKLPLGVHRGTGKHSFFLFGVGQGLEAQLGLLRSFEPNAPKAILDLAKEASSKVVNVALSKVVPHPALRELAREFPELNELHAGCHVLSQIIARALKGMDLGERERKILVATVGHLKQGRDILHRLLSRCPGYDVHLLNYELSRLRGTPLGCKRIHSLSGLGAGGIDCAFDLKKGEYAHPLLYCSSWESVKEGNKYLGRSEQAENLKDALVNLKTAIEVLERYL